MAEEWLQRGVAGDNGHGYVGDGAVVCGDGTCAGEQEGGDDDSGSEELHLVGGIHETS